MPTTDDAAIEMSAELATKIANTQALIDGIEAQLNSGMTQIKENDREMRFDLAALRDRRAELLSQLAGLSTSAAPRVRRLLTYTATKGL